MKQEREWITIPLLQCVDIEKTLSFWEALGFNVTYKQLRPYQYGVLACGGAELHFVRIKAAGAMNDFYRGCLIIVDDIEKVYAEFRLRFKENMGNSMPHSGIPRISRIRPEATRFTVTDISGNSIIFINHGRSDQRGWERANDMEQTFLQQSIAAAIRFRDYKEDVTAAARIIDAALKKAKDGSPYDIAEALIIRIDLAKMVDDISCDSDCRMQLSLIKLHGQEKVRLAQRHGVKL